MMMKRLEELSKEIRQLADTFHAEGFKDISEKLHDVARDFERKVNKWKSP